MSCFSNLNPPTQELGVLRSITHFISLQQNFTGVCVERDKLIGVLNPDGSARLLGFHPLHERKQTQRDEIEIKWLS